MSELVASIVSSDERIRNRSLDQLCGRARLGELLQECEALEDFRHRTESLYERVRALFFLSAVHRFHIPREVPAGKPLIPVDAWLRTLNRRFEEAIGICVARQRLEGPNDGLSSLLAAAYKGLAFQTLADQVRRSVRSATGKPWMFRTGHPADDPVRLRPELLQRSGSGPFPILREQTPVRMDLTHSGWSDIFFLGMDFPEGARVLNISVDLAVRGQDSTPPSAPVETYLRVIDRPVLRLVSIDLETSADIETVAEVFDFGRDSLGLLKAGVIASGLIPPGMEGSGASLADILFRVTGRPGCGIELVTHVKGIPKGSRLAVSTTLLAAAIAVCMRATGQARSLSGELQEHERRTIAARAVLGEWLGGSGGGWQDSGGVWPGIKVIQGVCSGPGDPEHGISRGRLLPSHTILTQDVVSGRTREQLQSSLVLVHGGMAQDVGPILEMVTEKYLLRSQPEWDARQEAIRLFDRILSQLEAGDIAAIGRTTTFTGARASRILSTLTRSLPNSVR